MKSTNNSMNKNRFSSFEDTAKQNKKDLEKAKKGTLKCRRCSKSAERTEWGLSVYGYCEECHKEFLEIIRAVQRFSDDER